VHAAREGHNDVSLAEGWTALSIPHIVLPHQSQHMAPIAAHCLFLLIHTNPHSERHRSVGRKGS